jgi:hypothetical protein
MHNEICTRVGFVSHSQWYMRIVTDSYAGGARLRKEIFGVQGQRFGEGCDGWVRIVSRLDVVEFTKPVACPSFLVGGQQ